MGVENEGGKGGGSGKRVLRPGNDSSLKSALSDSTNRLVTGLKNSHPLYALGYPTNIAFSM